MLLMVAHPLVRHVRSLNHLLVGLVRISAEVALPTGMLHRFSLSDVCVFSNSPYANCVRFVGCSRFPSWFLVLRVAVPTKMYHLVQVQRIIVLSSSHVVTLGRYLVLKPIMCIQRLLSSILRLWKARKIPTKAVPFGCFRFKILRSMFFDTIGHSVGNGLVLRHH
jgi:hypothetical protein